MSLLSGSPGIIEAARKFLANLDLSRLSAMGERNFFMLAQEADPRLLNDLQEREQSTD